MISNIQLTEEAEIEFHKILCYFQVLDLEYEFLEDLFSQFERINEMPNAFQVRYKTIRIAILDRFDYSIHYRVNSEGDIMVYHILHQSQDF